MIARNDAQILLEGLNYLTENTSAKAWRGTSRSSFLVSLSEIFLTDDIEQIRRDLQMISSGQISSNTTPQDVVERAENQGITKENLEVRVQEQRSQVKYWTNKIRQNLAAQKTAEKEVKTVKTATEVQKETSPKTQAETIKKDTVKQEVKEVPIREKPQKKVTVIPVTGEEKIEKEIPVGQKLENIQIKFDSSEVGSVKDRLNATQPFFVASLNSQKSEFADLSPSLNLISKGISSEELNNAANSLPEGPEKNTIHRISYTMERIEKIFPNEVSQIRNSVSIDNLEVQIPKVDFNPSPNNLSLSPNANSLGGYSISDGSSGIETIVDFAKNKVINKASSAILSKIKTKIGGKLAKTAVGKAASSLTAKLSGTAVGKALSAIGAKIGAALGSVAPIIGNIIGAIAGWLVEKLLPLINKIKNWLKEDGPAILTAATTIMLLPFYYVASSILVPILIILIAIPISIAIIMFIINSGAYIVPPKASTLGAVGAISAYIDIVKIADPSGPFQNSNLPLEIEYTVTVKAKKSGLANIRIEDKCSVVAEGTPMSCPNGEPQVSTIEIPETITESTPFSFSYKRLFNDKFKDTLTIDIITITADVPEKENAQAATSAAIKIGNPPDECPYNAWPLAGDAGINNVTQGPFAVGCSHQNMRAEAIDIGGRGLTVLAAHSGIATVKYDDCYGKTVDIQSTCGGNIFISRYSHLGNVIVNNGPITLGQTLGTTDNTGSCSRGDHLHFDFRTLDGGRVNPPIMNTPFLKRDIPTGCCNQENGIYCNK
ncbi:M23 family metallopeptidase [Patescibacteria group bacterium]|nr:M23 family metallopeptidase [Patescibacteria group bacterium]MBU2036559.1 M23 family metallopeptidase [Patescibacteria group bacterium]